MADYIDREKLLEDLERFAPECRAAFLIIEKQEAVKAVSGQPGITGGGVMTNGDYIRSLPDEELCEWLNRSCPPGGFCVADESTCEDCWLKWLWFVREEV